LSTLPLVTRQIVTDFGYYWETHRKSKIGYLL
jgi:hypothetical protein